MAPSTVPNGKRPRGTAACVILSLNHANSELRRREAGVLTFELDDHGRWVVLEPPASKRRD